MLRRRNDAWLAGVVAGSAVSGVCLWYFGWGMFYMQDLWDVSGYVGYLVGGLLAALAATIAGEMFRRSDKERSSGFAGGTAIGAARLMLALQVCVFLYCNAGPARTVANATVRRLATYGMARDLPAPPPAQ